MQVAPTESTAVVARTRYCSGAPGAHQHVDQRVEPEVDAREALLARSPLLGGAQAGCSAWVWAC